MTSVVTPWRTLGSWRGSARIIRPRVRVQVDEPGRDDLARASMRRAARTLARVAAARTRSRSPSTATLPAEARARPCRR